MLPRLLVLTLAAGLIAAPAHAAKCGLFGTQLECGLRAGDVVIGTQVSGEPSRATSSFRPQPFHGDSRLLAERTRPAGRVRIELQDIGADPSLCRRIGNEGYCY